MIEENINLTKKKDKKFNNNKKTTKTKISNNGIKDMIYH